MIDSERRRVGNAEGLSQQLVARARMQHASLVAAVLKNTSGCASREKVGVAVLIWAWSPDFVGVGSDFYGLSQYRIWTPRPSRLRPLTRWPRCGRV